MKKVKFNCRTQILMIPDDKYDSYREKMAKLMDDDLEKYTHRVKMGSPFPRLDVNVGDIKEVPDWYYERFKDSHVSQGISFDKYKDKNGGIIPFNMDEALRHADVTDITKTMKSVKMFELIESPKTKSANS